MFTVLKTGIEILMKVNRNQCLSVLTAGFNLQYVGFAQRNICFVYFSSTMGIRGIKPPENISRTYKRRTAPRPEVSIACY